MLDAAQGKTIKIVPSEAELRAISSRRSLAKSERSRQAADKLRSES